MQRFTPKLLTVLREGYTKKQFAHDAGAGLVVGIVALPLAIAFAIASGVRPEQGLFTAIIAGVIVSALGGSRVQVAGPTGAFIVIVYGIVQQYGYDGLAVATLLAGVLLIVMGLARLGTLLRFVPYPLTVGFTSGVAVVIASAQVRDLLGLKLEHVPADFIEKWGAYIGAAGSADMMSLAVGGASLLIIIASTRITHRIPGSIIAIVACTAAVQLLHLNVETVGSRFGDVPSMFPAPRLPHVGWSTITRMMQPAVTIALLGGIESLLSAVVADGMIRGRHRSNMELVAQGISNVVAPIFGGIPATGAIARTATNIKNGGRTPVAGLVHAATLLLIMLVFGRWASLIPLPTLAAILLVVSYHMSEWRSFKKILRSPKSDITVLLTTFFLTVLVDLTVAIEIGVVLSALLFIRRMAEVSQINVVTRDLQEETDEDEAGDARAGLPDGVEVFEVYGTLFFAAVDQFTESLRVIERTPKVLILDMKHLLAIDATGLHAIEEHAGQLRERGGTLLIAGIHKQPVFAMTQSGLLDRLGESTLHETLTEALDHSRTLVERKK